MRLVSKYEADLKEAKDYGLAPHHHPEPPEDPDFEELEEEHQLARFNLERLSARRISCVSLMENVLQYLRLCSLVLPSRMPPGKGAAGSGDIFASGTSTSAAIATTSARTTTTLSTDDAQTQFELLTEIQDEDENKILWLQLTLWLESALAGLEFAVV